MGGARETAFNHGFFAEFRPPDYAPPLVVVRPKFDTLMRAGLASTHFGALSLCSGGPRDTGRPLTSC